MLYLAFETYTGDSAGGWYDSVGVYATEAEARAAVERESTGEGHVIALDGLVATEVARYRQPGMGYPRPFEGVWETPPFKEPWD